MKTEIENGLNNYSEDLRVGMEGFKFVLEDKLLLLNNLDEEILGYIEEDEGIEKEIDVSSRIRNELQTLIIRINKKLEVQMDGGHSGNGTRTEERSAPTAKRNAKLPELKLKSFGGNPLEFRGFWDHFKAAIHNDETLEKITKFNYLRNNLNGTAYSAIAGLSLTSQNYDEAVKIIEERFGNKQLLITTNIDKLLSIPPVASTSNVEGLREVYNKIETYARNLKTLDVEKEKYGPILISIVMSKIPSEIKLIAYYAPK